MNTITLEFNNAPNNYNIYDLTGKLINTVNNPNSKLIEIDKSTLPKGLYLFTASFDGYIVTSKVIIE